MTDALGKFMKFPSGQVASQHLAGVRQQSLRGPRTPKAGCAGLATARKP